jgi:hypothetical protein
MYRVIGSRKSYLSTPSYAHVAPFTLPLWSPLWRCILNGSRWLLEWPSETGWTAKGVHYFRLLNFGHGTAILEKLGGRFELSDRNHDETDCFAEG